MYGYIFNLFQYYTEYSVYNIIVKFTIQQKLYSQLIDCIYVTSNFWHTFNTLKSVYGHYEEFTTILSEISLFFYVFFFVFYFLSQNNWNLAVFI